jgi:hypothetical protein
MFQSLNNKKNINQIFHIVERMSKSAFLRNAIRPLFEKQLLTNPESFGQFSNYLATRYPLPIDETSSISNVIQWTQNDQLSQTIGFGEVMNNVFEKPCDIICIIWEKLQFFFDKIIDFLTLPAVQSFLWTSLKIGTLSLVITVTAVGVRFVYVKIQESKRISNQYQEILNSAYCVVCQDNQKTHVVIPCGHFCLCHSCSSTLNQNRSRCPLCQQTPTSYQRVYY